MDEIRRIKIPEGAEVKRCSEVIQREIDHKVLYQVNLISGKISRVGVKNLEKLNLPSKILRIYTRGKIIFIELEGEFSLISTLGMSGWWYPSLDSITQGDLSDAYYAKVIDTITKAEKYIRFQLITTDGSIVNYIDPRNFGNFYVVSQQELIERRDALGVDFLNDEHVVSQFEKIKQKKYANKCIGEILLDQSIIAGLGNIYRAETMYLARISPHLKCIDISEKNWRTLERAAELVLKTAYHGRGTMFYTVNDIYDYLGDKSNKFYEIVTAEEQRRKETIGMINRHLVYGCKTDIMNNPVLSESIGGRTCWWVPNICKV